MIHYVGVLQVALGHVSGSCAEDTFVVLGEVLNCSIFLVQVSKLLELLAVLSHVTFVLSLPVLDDVRGVQASNEVDVLKLLLSQTLSDFKFLQQLIDFFFVSQF